ncbi:cation efflux family-domain-containing protein [Syncephalastrum racemosum]|uniref:Cation efflux family-domain-containing protein n=1 Tax=Syncephalastrum racemosum TaxID=13706 RepID=A0A1X2HQ36_SYNRA|nr:cation efflux family-domain-containing protein [Syncephalastrum racemosum]
MKGLNRQVRICIMLCINGAFFLAEIVIGYYVSSLALVADSFHMLNDMLSLGVALWAIKVAMNSRRDDKYSYGWQRAEILGALVNAVFLLALCVMIVIEAIQRFVEPQPVTDPLLVLITGGAGLVGNLVGLFLFHEHGHGHGHHHHQHPHNDVEHQHGPVSAGHHDHNEGGHMNMKGIFLHVMGDALGNIGVIVSALFIWLTDFSWRFYLDPIVSIIISIIIFISALPLVRDTSFILLQGVPSGVPLDDVRQRLLELEDVLSVHELHIWQLSDTKLIASLHVQLRSHTNYMNVATQMRQLLHTYRIHSVTIQPEFVDEKGEKDSKLVKMSPSSSSAPVTQKEPDEAILKHKKSTSGLVSPSESTCLLQCVNDSCAENACCPPPAAPAVSDIPPLSTGDQVAADEKFDTKNTEGNEEQRH